jgi:hypothetical protein
MEADEIPFPYLWIYKKFCDRWGRCNIIVYTTEVKEVMRRTIYQIPKRYDDKLLKQMERYDLILRINKHKTKILGAMANKRLKKIDSYSIF